MRRSHRCVPACLCLAAALFPGPARAQDKPAILSLADLIERAEPSCVRLDVVMDRGQAIGSGFVVDRDGHIRALDRARAA